MPAVEEPVAGAPTAEPEPTVEAQQEDGQSAGKAGASVGNPLSGRSLYGPHVTAARAAAQLAGRGDAALLAHMASVPTAMWLGPHHGDVRAAVRQRVAEAWAAGAVPVFVSYNMLDLDCDGRLAGNPESPAAYAAWIGEVAAGIGAGEALVVLEPDTLAHLCGDQAQRFAMLQAAVGILEANPGTYTYLDAGHSNWMDASTMAGRLRAAGVDQADGFALNVANFQRTADNIGYGSAVSAALGGAHFVVDTSRNGNGPGNDWCNPSGRALGEPSTTATGHPLVDAFLWIKPPGESDGTCNGGPPAGQFWTGKALELARG